MMLVPVLSPEFENILFCNAKLRRKGFFPCVKFSRIMDLNIKRRRYYYA